MNNEKVIHELIHKVQVEHDQRAKQTLLEKCFLNGCRFAKRVLKNEIYTNMIIPTDNEIQSLVYQAFEKSVKWMRVEGGDKPTSSFKTFFYSMIKFQIYRELKTTLNYRVIPTQEIKNYWTDERRRKQEALEAERNAINKEQISFLMGEVLDFLCKKNAIYAQIALLKYHGYPNKEICRRLEISELVLKSKIQYIKKLIRTEFDFQSAHF